MKSTIALILILTLHSIAHAETPFKGLLDCINSIDPSSTLNHSEAIAWLPNTDGTMLLYVQDGIYSFSNTEGHFYARPQASRKTSNETEYLMQLDLKTGPTRQPIPYYLISTGTVGQFWSATHLAAEKPATHLNYTPLKEIPKPTAHFEEKLQKLALKTLSFPDPATSADLKKFAHTRVHAPDRNGKILPDQPKIERLRSGLQLCTQVENNSVRALAQKRLRELFVSDSNCPTCGNYEPAH